MDGGTFASFAVICSFATGNAIQSFTVSDQIYSEFKYIFNDVNHPYYSSIKYFRAIVSFLQIITGLIMSFIVGVVIIGGIKRIGVITGFLAPIMALIYVISASVIIISNYSVIPESFAMIISMAFNPPATIAGTGGG